MEGHEPRHNGDGLAVKTWESTGAATDALAGGLNSIEQRIRHVTVHGPGEGKITESDGIVITIFSDGDGESGNFFPGGTRWSFGWGRTAQESNLAPNQVYIAPGHIEGRYGYRRVAGEIVTVGGNRNARHLIIVTGNETQARIETNSVDEGSFSGDTAHTFRRALYRVYIEDEQVVLDCAMSGVGGVVL